MFYRVSAHWYALETWHAWVRNVTLHFAETRFHEHVILVKLAPLRLNQFGGTRSDYRVNNAGT